PDAKGLARGGDDPDVPAEPVGFIDGVAEVGIVDRRGSGRGGGDLLVGCRVDHRQLAFGDAGDVERVRGLVDRDAVRVLADIEAAQVVLGAAVYDRDLTGHLAGDVNPVGPLVYGDLG